MSGYIVGKSTQIFSKENVVSTLLKNSNCWIDFSDATKYTTTGTGNLTLASVTDKSNDARAITVTGTPSFDEGTNSMFNLTAATGNYLSVTLAGPDVTRKAETIFIVLGPSQSSSNPGVLGATNLGTRYVRYTTNYGYGIQTSTPVIGGAAFTLGSIQIGSMTCEGGSTKVYNNGRLEATATTNFTAASTVTQIGRAGSSTYVMYGNLYEVIFFSDQISDDHRLLIEYYLAQKWKITNTLSSPTGITGCTLWLDGNDATTFTYSSGTSISQWNDKSGNNYHATQAVATNQPTYDSTNKGVVFVQSSVQRLVSTAPYTGSANNECVYIVFTPSTVSTNADLIGTTDSARGRQLRIVAGPRLQIWNGATGSTVGVQSPLSTSLKYLVEFVNVTGRCLMNTNRAVDFNSAKISFATGSWTQVIGGCGTGGAAVTYQGTIYEVVVYNRALTGSERQSIRNYLLNKWNIANTITLSNGLTYTNIPPAMRFLNPLDIDNCILWLDAADTTSLTLSGSTVTAWKDKSLNAYTGTSSGSPTIVNNVAGNLPAISFNGTTQYFDFGNVNNLGTASINIYTVAKFNTTGDGTIIAKSLYGPGAGRYAIYRLTGQLVPALEVSGGTTVGTGIADTNTTTRIVAMVWNRATDFLYVNGNTSFSTAIANTTSLSNTYNLLVGAYNNGTGTTPPQAGLYLNGYIMEILVYNKTLSVGERQVIEGYLAQKWGISKSLFPSIHTFKSEYSLSPRFDPRKFGCKLWLDAADPNGNGIIPTSGTAIQTWVDKSGNDKSCSQSNVANRPRFDYDGIYPGIRFTRANSQYLTQNAPVGLMTSTSYGIFIVSRPVAVPGAGAKYYAFYSEKSNKNTVQYAGLIEISGTVYKDVWTLWYDYASTTNPTNKNFNIPNILPPYYRSLVAVSDDSVMSTMPFYYNGASGTPWWSSTGTAANVATDTYGYMIGSTTTLGVWDGNATCFDGFIHEIIVMITQPTTRQRQQIEGYLAWKWGLQMNLPSTHPYSKYPP